MSIKSGFSLIECLIYCTIFSFLCMIIFGWVGTMSVHFCTARNKVESMLDVHATADIFLRDCIQAPSQAHLWKNIKDDHIVWNTPTGDIGWLKQENALYRITGNYDYSRWITSTKNLVSNSCDHASFTVIKNRAQEIEAVQCILNGTHFHVALRNKKGGAQ